MQIHKANGLCFNHEEKDTPFHKCANKKLLLLQWNSKQHDSIATEYLLDHDPYDQMEDRFQKLCVNAMNSAPISGTMRGILTVTPFKFF